MSAAILSGPSLSFPIRLENNPQEKRRETVISITSKVFSEIDFLQAFSNTDFRWSKSIFEYPATFMTMKISPNWTLDFENIPFVFLEVMAKKALDSDLFPRETQIIAGTKYCSWKLDNGFLNKDSVDTFKIFENAGDLIKTKTVTQEEVRQLFPALRKPSLRILSSNFPLPDPNVFNGSYLVQDFKESIKFAHNSFPDFEILELRFEGICNYQKKDLKYALRKLQAENLTLEFHEPCFIVDNVTEEVMETFQSLSAFLMNNKKDPQESISITHKVFEIGKISAELTVSIALEQISEQLAFVAKKGTLVCRYAYNVIGLNDTQQTELLQQLEDLGYQVSIDECPFICVRYNVLKKYIYIDLPFSSALLRKHKSSSEINLLSSENDSKTDDDKGAQKDLD